MSYHSTLCATFFQSSARIGNTTVGSISYPGLDVSKDHLQASTASNTSAILIANTDSSKSIVVHSIFICLGVQELNALSDYFVPIVGTISCTDNADDIFRFSTAVTGSDSIFEGPVVLPRGSSLIHYNIDGPGNTTSSYTVNVTYTFTSTASPTITVTEPEGEDGGGGGGGGGGDGGDGGGR